MNKKFKNFSHQDILLIEDFIEYIKTLSLENSFMVLLMHTDDKIVPTLSVVKRKEKNTAIESFNSIDDICELFKIERQKNFLSLLKN